MAKHTKKKCRTVRGRRVCKSKTKRAVKGARSKTHKGRLDYTTKKGDKDFHRKGHDEKHAAKSRRVRKPYVRNKKGGVNFGIGPAINSPYVCNPVQGCMPF
jgi:hypothetical protein